MAFWEKVSNIDRRWIYLLVAIAVFFPMIFIMQFPVELTPEAEQLFDAINNLPDSSIVMLTFDYYPSAMAETRPMSIAALRHMFSKNMKVVTLSNIPLGGPTIAEDVTRAIAKEYGKVYGADYVNLGYRANYTAVMHGLASSIESIFKADFTGTPLKDLPLMQKVKNYNDIRFIFVVADNATIDYWISIVNAQYGIPVGGGVTAVVAPKMYAFIETGQLTGLLGGMKGAAEYEKLVNITGTATRGMDSQSMVHFLIIFFVVVGNIAYFATRKSEKGH
ncbi:MAG: hypothetical protein CVT49_08780 [candidate division Zixibacteria bacterium HGW-Zixibacteria-1]|nr:MAG: hypothetical protein CVT49_08780 [candidate division Zixibacteria bacterium HGW-Zixibacteria-1]